MNVHQVLQPQTKVGHWLSEQHDLPSGEDDQTPKLVATWDLLHMKTKEGRVYLGNSFSISESGTIGISCHEKPSLSVVYPNTDKAIVILSDSKVYYSATFVKVFGKEYLAAVCVDDGCLYLWDTESEILKKVFDPKLPSEQRYKDMNICTIDESTIGYGEVWASPDGSRRVFILKTDTDELTLSSTLRLFTPNIILDMCYTEAEGGTPCLLLCVPSAHRIMAVEMVGGKTRWEAGKEQMGEKFYPCSICTDEDNTVYVADFEQIMIHLLSPEDGSIITSIDGRHYGIVNPVAVRIHGQQLYIEHYRYPSDKYAISKFKRNI